MKTLSFEPSSASHQDCNSHAVPQGTHPRTRSWCRCLHLWTAYRRVLHEDSLKLEEHLEWPSLELLRIGVWSGELLRIAPKETGQTTDIIQSDCDLHLLLTPVD